MKSFIILAPWALLQINTFFGYRVDAYALRIRQAQPHPLARDFQEGEFSVTVSLVHGNLGFSNVLQTAVINTIFISTDLSTAIMRQ